MYIISKITGKIYNEDYVEIPQDDRFQQWKDYVLWVKNGGVLNEFEGTPEEIAEQQAILALQKETDLYKKRIQDGINAYAEISAEFRLAKLNGIISDETQKAVERALIPVRNEVLAGQWISAKNELELLGSEIIGNELYNRLHSQITNYILENYDDNIID